MATPRHRLVDPHQPLFYHLVSRCVRRSWLCGWDKTGRRDYTHRKQWLIERMERLARAFPIEVHAYAIMSNHFHLVVFYDPKAAESWTDAELVRRWLIACPPRDYKGDLDRGQQELHTELLLDQPERLLQMRKRLGSLSTFMQFLKQPIARRANLEDGCRGHFFEQRFYSGALLSEEAVLAAMAYVDLNPVRAQIAQTLSECRHTSLEQRLSAADLEAALEPLVSGLENAVQLSFSFGEYVELLETRLASQKTAHGLTRWHRWVSALKRQQRVYGSSALIKDWLARRGMHSREAALG